MLVQPPTDPEAEAKKAEAENARGVKMAANDPAYVNAVPGLRQVFTDDALLDLWVRDQQIAWLKSGEATYNVEELRERVRKRVEALKDRELKQTVRGLRRELTSYSLFVVLFSMVLTAFTLGESYAFSTKVKAQVLQQRLGATFEDVLTQDDAWDWMVNRLTPVIARVPADTRAEYDRARAVLQRERISAE